MQTTARAVLEKPQNGIQGLRHWRQDVIAGLLVSLVSLPLSLGIAVASGAPPIAGLISAIIAGLLLPFLGGTYLTISGPAAGLAPALLAAMATLGRGDLAAGYPLLLCVICITGGVQIVLSFFKAARFSQLFPASVIEGMLCAIGLLIIAKQLPFFIGHEFKSHEFFGLILETPYELTLMEPKVFLVSSICLASIFLLTASKSRWLKLAPPPLIVVVLGVLLGQLFQIDPKFNIHVPSNFMQHGIVLPDFAQLFSARSLWVSIGITVVTLTLIDGVESLATAAAIDKIDPFHRKSNPNRTLLAMGISNICSSLAGGLTIIPGGVKSKVCIVAGGRTLWANFYNAIFLLSYLFIATSIINLIPLGALSAVLIYTGYKLCEPRLWRHIAAIGREQLLVFTFTVAATLATDLLWGIILGMVAKLALTTSLVRPSQRQVMESEQNLRPAPFGMWRRIAELFSNPVVGRSSQGDEYHLQFDRPLVCFNLPHVNRELAAIPPDAKQVYLHLNHGVSLVDHTSCENLLSFVTLFEDGGARHVEIDGLGRMWKRSPHEASMHHRSMPRRLAPRAVAPRMPELLAAQSSSFSSRAADLEAVESSNCVQPEID